MTKQSTPKVRFIDPPNTLKIKVGHGGIAPELLKQGQKHIDTAETDFTPYAEVFLKKIEAQLIELKENPALQKDEKYLLKFGDPIMGLKANGGMFHYPLISMVSDVCLRFIDNAGELNGDAANIIHAHNTSVRLLLKAQLKGFAGPEGNKITQELEAACERYFKKYKIKT